MATHLRIERIRRDLSTRQLAEKAGLGYQTLSRLERGEHSCSRPLAQALADSLNVPLSLLFEERPGYGQQSKRMLLWAREDVVK